jgi:KEOPS complex subunit Pcc1
MEAEFVVDCKEPEIIYNSLKVEGIKAKVYLENTSLIINLNADDITEMRAAINGWLRLIKMCEKLLEVLE